MAKLNQIIAIEKGVKSRVYGEITVLNKTAQTPDLFSGFTRTYRKKAEEGEDLPGETKRVQWTVPHLLKAVEIGISELIQITARKDYTNCVGKADVVVNGTVLVKDAPVPFLLFLEKQLTDLRTLFGNLPVLDPVEEWRANQNSGLYTTAPVETHRTKKVQRALVLYPATPEHPAQTQMVTEDEIAGFWSMVKQSGALPAPVKAALIGRTNVLLDAVKEAREKANGVEEVAVEEYGKALFNYLLGE